MILMRCTCGTEVRFPDNLRYDFDDLKCPNCGLFPAKIMRDLFTSAIRDNGSEKPKLYIIPDDLLPD